jgi:pimeloyl-ACP methyl ester carboxylesterase
VLKTIAAGAAKGIYASVNGLRMYYETHGSGRPLVLLHGGLNTIETSFGPVLPYFATTRQVIAVEQQAHGHTADIDRPLTFEQMADDTATLLERLGLESVDIFGYSVGGTIALQIAIRYPKRVRKLVLASAIYALDGYQPVVAEGLRHATAETMPASLREAYAKVAPRPEDWPRLVAKMARLAADFKGYAPADIRSVNAPTLVITGDADIVRLEHTVELSRLLTRGQLAVLPGANHFSYLMERPDWLLAMMSTFLDAPVPKAD